MHIGGWGIAQLAIDLKKGWSLVRPIKSILIPDHLGVRKTLLILHTHFTMA